MRVDPRMNRLGATPTMVRIYKCETLRSSQSCQTYSDFDQATVIHENTIKNERRIHVKALSTSKLVIERCKLRRAARNQCRLLIPAHSKTGQE
jgi:hypothetical protein